MAEIHETTVEPGKLELLTRWLPTRPWYTGAGSPALTKSGGFRLDDPDGEVGIELMVVTDTEPGAPGDEPVVYLVPMTYRGAPVEGLDHALIGTAEHGVLGPRWFYDAAYDTVFIEQAAQLLTGKAIAQDQNTSDTPDLTVHVVPGDIFTPAPGFRPTVIDTEAHTDIAFDSDRSTNAGAELIRLHRHLRVGAGLERDRSHVDAPWSAPDGSLRRAVFLSAP
ncbi:maltokinase N-terminal cap-like domain-containing protein [Nocardia sp. CDC160]|uniref:maltokinase N-terminal cap-like domain-containing protein n=1 Tax=Nocardia sp. CDC160 TaxID=3112166 RepID=UPI002DBB4C1D|nr:1,4-alpha-glucan branching protein [Nocardia sp. CDC160]MEC3917619.1 1,4-alpha-glucan branching protein [Nocardia sp. CDC160]